MNKFWDIDLPYGEEAEKLVRELLGSAGRVEVKRERKARETGNISVEFKCRGRPSGIAITQAEWWATQLNDDCVVFVKTARMKEIARHYYRSNGSIPSGDEKASECVLVPVKSLLLDSFESRLK